jgi:dihydrofolate synthase/folylpolyglutamate synthase
LVESTTESELLDQLASRPVREDLAPVREALSRVSYGADQVVQVVGSNGKGSVVHFLTAAVEDVLDPVLSYTSPHFYHPAERFRIDDQSITAERFHETLQTVSNRITRDLSPFEWLFLVSAELSRTVDPSLWILEAGMGGRWDATSAVPADVTVLTGVEREHTEFLGEDRPSIAREQTAQIPSDSLLITVDQPPEVMDVIARRRDEKSLDLVMVDHGETVTETLVNLSAETARRVTGSEAGGFEKRIREAGEPPGRGESLERNGVRYLLDVAHTPAAVRRLLEERLTDFEGRLFCVFGCLEGKEASSMVDHLLSGMEPERFYAVEPNSPRSLSPERYLPDNLGNDGEGQKEPREVLDDIDQQSRPGDCVIVTGSFSIVGTARQWLGDESP